MNERSETQNTVVNRVELKESSTLQPICGVWFNYEEEAPLRLCLRIPYGHNGRHSGELPK